MDLLNQFKKFLFSQQNVPSKVTVKNYLSDINNFVKWYEDKFQTAFSPEAVTKTTIDNYKTDFSENLSPVSLQRHLSSLRKFFYFLVLENKITNDPFKPLAKLKDETDPWKLKEFKNFLYVYNASHLTIKNYIIDVKQFLNWAEEVTGNLSEAGANVFKAINSELLEEYKKRLLENGDFSPATINRKLSSLRKYVAWALEENLISPFELGLPNPQEEKLNPAFLEEKEFSQLPKIAPVVRANYSKIPPVRLLQKITKGIDSLLEAALITHLAKGVEASVHLAWQIKGQPIFDAARKIRLPRYIEKADIFGVRNIKKEFYAPLELSFEGLPRWKQVWLKLRYQRPKWYKTYHSYTFAHYLHFVVLMVFIAGLALGFYNGFVKSSNPGLAAVPPVAPNRILSFQGRLTDNNSNPLTTPTNLRFAIYSDPSSSASGLLWQEVDQVSPDTDGIFNINLGNTGFVCPSPTGNVLGKCVIPSTLFTQNFNLWLGISVESTSELTPRQQIATVAFAVNSETLQGLLPITSTASGVTNVVLALDSTGNLTIGSGATVANPVFSANGNFTFQTNSGSNGNLLFLPNGTGRVGINTSSPLATLDLRGNSGTVAVASISGKQSSSSLIVNNDGVGDIFTASSSGVARFTITSLGGIGLGPNGTNIGLSSQCLTGGVIPSWGTCGSGSGPSWWNQVGGLVYPTNNGWDVAFGGSATSSSLFTFQHTDSNFSNQPSISIWNAAAHNNGLTLTASSTDSTIDSTTGTINIGHGGGTLFIQTDIQNDSANNLGAIQITDRLNILPASASNNSNASLIVNNPGTGDIFTASQGGTQKFSITNAGGIRLATNEGSSNNCLLSGGTGAAASWGSCDPNGFGWWNQVRGLVYPTNSGWDFAVGGNSTASADFSITNLFAGNFVLASLSGRLNIADSLARTSPTPIATISGKTDTVVLSINNNGSGDLITASNGGNTKFTVDRNGQVIANSYVLNAISTFDNTQDIIQSLGAGDITISARGDLRLNLDSNNNGANALRIFGNGNTTEVFRVSDTGLVGIGNTAPAAALDVTHPLSFGATGQALAIFNQIENQDLFTASASGTPVFTVTRAGGISLGSNGLQVGNSSQCLLGGTTASWGSCGSAGVNWWDQVGGLVYPDNAGWDFAVGGNSTASAVFSVIGAAPFNTFPYASLSGRLNIADNLSRTSPTPIATISGRTNTVVLSLNNNGSGDLLTASNGGNTKFTVDRNGFIGIGTKIFPGNTADLTLRNGQTIDNATNNQIQIGANTTALTGVLTVNGTSGTGINITNTGIATDISLQNGQSIDNDSANQINLNLGASGTLLLTSSTLARLNSSTTLNINANNAISTTIGNATGTLTLTGTNVTTGQVAYGNSNSVNFTTGGSTGNCLTFNSGSAPTWNACSGSSGVNWWDQVGGLVYPDNTGWDFAVGGNSTASAVFSVIGAAPFNTFPYASLSGRLNIADNLKRTSPTPIATISGRTNTVVLSVNNNGGGDLITASNGANTQFVVKGNGNVGIGFGARNPTHALELGGMGGTNAEGIGFGTDTALYRVNPGYLLLNANGTSNLARLDIQGAAGTSAEYDVELSGDAFARLRSYTTTSNAGYLLGPGNTNQDINIARGGTSRLFFDDNGVLPTSSLVIGINNNYAAPSIISTFDIRGANGWGTFSVASVSGRTSFAALVANNDGVGDLFTASKSGLSRFVIKNNGNVGIGTTLPTASLHVSFNGAPAGTQIGTQIDLIGANQDTVLELSSDDGQIGPASDYMQWTFQGNAIGVIKGDGKLGVGTASPISQLHITRPLTVQQNALGKALAVFDQIENQDIFAASKSGVPKFIIGQNGEIGLGLTGGATGVQNFGNSGQCLQSAGSGAIAAWGSCGTGGSGVNWWNQVGGLVYPTNTGWDFAVGGSATTSALFSYTGIKTGSKTIASVSGNLVLYPNNGFGGKIGIGTTPDKYLDILAPAGSYDSVLGGQIKITAADTLLTGLTLNNTSANGRMFTIGSSGASACPGAGDLEIFDNTAGGVNCVGMRFRIDSAGRIGIGTGSLNLLSTLDIRTIGNNTNGGTISVASASGKTSYATFVTNNDGAGDLFTASASGWPRFTIKNDSTVNITGTFGTALINIKEFPNSQPRLVMEGDANFTGFAFGSGAVNGSTNQDIRLYRSNSTSLVLDDFGVSGRNANLNLFTNNATGAIGIYDSVDNIARIQWQAGGNANTALIMSDGQNTDFYLQRQSTGNFYTLNSGTTSYNLRLAINSPNSTPISTFDVRGSSGTLAVASFSGKTSFATTITNNDGVGDLFTASQSGWTRFVIKGDGKVGIGTNLPQAQLDIAGSSSTISNTAGDITITPTGNLVLGSGGFNVGGSIGAGTNCLLGGASPAWGACGSGGTNWWNQTGGLVYPANTGWDFAVGSTATSSALFSYTGVKSGKTIASISGQLIVMPNNGFSGKVGIGITAPDSTLSIKSTAQNAVVNIYGLTGGNNFDYGVIQVSSEGDLNNSSARPLALQPNGGAVGIGATNFAQTAPLATLEVRANNGTLSIASASGKTSYAAMVVDNTGVGDLFTASHSGATRFTIAQNGTLIQTTTLASVGELQNYSSVPNINNTWAVANQQGDSGTLVPNSGFESALTLKSFADGWAVTSTSSATVTRDNSTSAKGNSSAKVTATSNTQFAAFYSPCIPLSSIGKYTLSLYGRVSAANGATVRANLDLYTSQANCQSNTTATMGPVTGANISSANTWTSIPGTTGVAMPSGTSTTWGRAHIYVAIPISGRTVNVDGIRLIQQNDVIGTDYAENYPTDPNNLAEPGDLVSVQSINQISEVKPTDKSLDEAQIGIVSTNPGQVIGDDVPLPRVPVALAGRVPTKVSSINGAIHVGDPLQSSDIPGVAVKATKLGPTVAVANENYDGTNGTDYYEKSAGVWQKVLTCDTQSPNCTRVSKIVASIKMSYFDPTPQIASIQNLVLHDQNASQDFSVPHYFTINDALGNPLTKIGGFLELAAGNLKAGYINAGQIITDSLSVTSDKVKIAGQSLHDYVASVVNEVLDNGGYISPLDTSGGIAIYDHATGTRVASIDTQGNASFSGTLNVQKDATIAGTLRAKKIIADEIEGLNIKASTVSATNITNVTNIYSTDPFPTLPSSPSSQDNSGIFAGLLSSNKFVNIATLSSQLAYVENLNAVSATVANGLTVYGNSSLSDTSINGQLSINGTFILNNNSINVLGSDLNLQPLRQGGLSIMAGLIYVDTDGNMQINNNLTVKGTLFADKISSTNGTDVNIGSPSALLTIKPTGDVIASGSGTFDKLNIGRLVGTALAVSPTEVIATGSAGTATINAGRTEITIDNKLVTDKSLIYITPTSQTAQPLFLLRQIPGVSFTVGIETWDVSPIKFNWIIIN